MSFDGSEEVTAFNGLLDTLSEPYFEGVSDDTEIPVDFAGAPTGHYVVTYGQPVAAARDRRAGVTEAEQPHIFPIRVTAVSGSAEKTGQMTRAMMAAVVGQSLSDNATEVKSVGGGYMYPVTGVESKPTEWRQDTYLQVTNNMVTAV